MRTKSTKQQYLDFSRKSRLKVVNEYRKKYKIISQLLDDNPQLVSLVHQDLAKMLSQSKRGRKSEYTSEQILRSLIVMFVEQDSLRQVVIRIENSEEFKDGQRFRAGCEGGISVLKRVFNLGRCLFKGFKNYAAGVGCAVFCHNLILLTRL